MAVQICVLIVIGSLRRSSAPNGNFHYPAVAMVYGVENSIAQATTARAPQSVQTQQHTRGLAGKRPSRFDYQQSAGVLPVQQTATASLIHSHRLTTN